MNCHSCDGDVRVIIIRGKVYNSLYVVKVLSSQVYNWVRCEFIHWNTYPCERVGGVPTLGIDKCDLRNVQCHGIDSLIKMEDEFLISQVQIKRIQHSWCGVGNIEGTHYFCSIHPIHQRDDSLLVCILEGFRAKGQPGSSWSCANQSSLHFIQVLA